MVKYYLARMKFLKIIKKKTFETLKGQKYGQVKEDKNCNRH